MVDREPIDRLADAARRAIERAKDLSVLAADKIDSDTYTASAMVDTASALAGLAMRGYLEFVGLALNRREADTGATERPEPAPQLNTAAATEQTRVTGNGLGANIRVMSEWANLVFHRNLDMIEQFVDERVPDATEVVTDHMTTVVRRMADQAKTVVDKAAAQLDSTGYGPDDWASTVVKLGDIALINGIELAGTAIGGPGHYETEPIASDLFVMEHAQPDRAHTLSMVSPLVLAGGDEVVTEERVTFEPAGGVLPPGTDRFQIHVKAAGLRSGIYVGTVWAVPVDAPGAPPTDEPASKEVVQIIIGL